MSPDGYAHVVWEETKTDMGPVYIVYTTNAIGDTFIHPQDIYPSGPSYEHQRHPSIAVSNEGTVHVVWTQYKDIFYTFKTSDTQWETPVRVCSSSTYSAQPCLVADYDGFLHLAWIEDNTTLYYTSKSNDNNWTDPRVYTINFMALVGPKLAISTSGVGIVFDGYIKPDSAGLENYEIFFIEEP